MSSFFQASLRTRYQDVNWELTGCSRGGCFELAELHIDGLGQLCVRCADEYIDRLNAIGEYRGLELRPWHEA